MSTDSSNSAGNNTPNLYQLHGQHMGNGHHLSITYSTSGIDGKPSFQYQDEQQTLSFRGDEITTTATDIGTLVTVPIRRTVDSGGTTFTLLVPRVNLGATHQVLHITTEGITTLHRFSLIPSLNHGQTELYSVTRLTGTAQQVDF